MVAFDCWCECESGGWVYSPSFGFAPWALCDVFFSFAGLVCFPVFPCLFKLLSLLLACSACWYVFAFAYVGVVGASGVFWCCWWFVDARGVDFVAWLGDVFTVAVFSYRNPP